MIDMKKIIAGAVAGIVSAAVIDIDAWAKWKADDHDGAAFDWGVAVKRWVSGAVSGVLAALGFGQFDNTLSP